MSLFLTLCGYFTGLKLHFYIYTAGMSTLCLPFTQEVILLLIFILHAPQTILFFFRGCLPVFSVRKAKRLPLMYECCITFVEHAQLLFSGITCTRHLNTLFGIYFWLVDLAILSILKSHRSVSSA